MNQPFISVIIPAYNGEIFLAEGIDSIERQHYAPLEIIVVDDGSTDNTAQIAQSFNRVRYVYQPNSGGPAKGRNRGLDLAQGEFIAFLDQDDLWPDHKLKTQVTYLANHPHLDMVLGQVQIMRFMEFVDDQPHFEATSEDWANLLLGSGLYRKGVFEKVGRFDETLSISDDLDWIMRARELMVSMVIMEEVTLFYRLHQHNTINNTAARQHDFLMTLKKSLDRRRQGQNATLSVPQFSDFRKSPSPPSDCKH